MKKTLKYLVILIIFASLTGLAGNIPVQAEVYLLSREMNSSQEGIIDPALRDLLEQAQPGELIPVIITMKKQVDLSSIGGPDREARVKGIITALKAIATSDQKKILALLEIREVEQKAEEIITFWVFNGLSASITRDVVYELALREDVWKITPAEVQVEPVSLPGMSTIEPNLSVVGAPALWALGYEGQGIVVASMDSGVDVNHPDLGPSWRGGNNSWFDPYGEHPLTPTDLSGHGTGTMGVMVGRDTSGTAIGMAPQAQWIAVKIFNDSGAATATAIHLGFQWLLDPDNNPNTLDTPHVVNNSWVMSGPGCNLEFELDLQALRAADILSVFAAGNGGPNNYTSYSPGNNPSAFAVGGTDNTDNIYLQSSRGPSSCGETESIYPELVAPGVNIFTSERYGLYTRASGTSLSAPHVSGGLALLLSAYPNLGVNEQSMVLTHSAVDLGSIGPDNSFGFGRLDLLAAFQYLQSMPSPTPTPFPEINLALNKPSFVSSYQDTSHSGSQAVDGDLVTYWQSKKASGKKVSGDEWIKVDLGSVANINQVILDWDTNFATVYDLQISSDDQVWSTVFTTANGDGGSDTIDLTGVSARYISMVSTAWNDSVWRAWLQEFQVVGNYADLPPNPTSTPQVPTSTPTPVPPTPTPGSTISVHVGDLDGTSIPKAKGRWDAEIVITIHDSIENPVSGATVTGNWTGDTTGSTSCTTATKGQCTVIIRNLKPEVISVIFNVTDVSAIAGIYDPADNHDPDGDSNGVYITVTVP